MALYTIDCACDNQPMKATKLIHIKEEHAQGFIEAVIWQVPEPVPPSEHAFKYRLVYSSRLRQ